MDVVSFEEKYHEMLANVEECSSSKIKEALCVVDKLSRRNKIEEAREEVFNNFESTHSRMVLDSLFESILSKIMRNSLLDTKKRIDGRDLSQVRKIECDVDILPKVHGSALFTRGETQAIVVSTLGSSSDEQIIDSIEGDRKERFLLHYNFPSYSVGETGRMGAPGRREIGHGKLAWRALHPVLPSKESFPYTIRVVSEITESNGSSSMATVCGTSLSLM